MGSVPGWGTKTLYAMGQLSPRTVTTEPAFTTALPQTKTNTLETPYKQNQTGNFPPVLTPREEVALLAENLVR